MRRNWARVLAGIVAVLSVLGIVWSLPGAGAREKTVQHASRSQLRPMVFVHGFSGSGAQWETQALRFTSNGYRPDLIAVHEYDSLFGVETRDQVFSRLDARIATLRTRTHSDKVDLLGHSLGTSLMQAYLNSSPSRAASVAHYVNLDGLPAASPPGGVPTLAIWGSGSTARRITGATNIYFPNQTHVQVVTSPETFEEVYSFFTGAEPATTDVLPETGSRVRISGRAQNFPQNTGVEDATLRVYEVNGATGRRARNRPDATFALRGDGAWGPFNAVRGRDYEFAIVGPDGTHHFYGEPYVRSDAWVRLLTSPVDAGIGALIERSPNHAALTIVRYQELWGDQGTQSDVLAVNGANLLNATNSPRSKLVNAVLVFDAGSDRVTNLGTPIGAISGLPFLAGVDMFVRAANPPDDTISVALTSRLGGGHTETVNVPNWASATDAITVQFHEYPTG
jgi:pimeloyl-ACP methyl ester carboxylesterase